MKSSAKPIGENIRILRSEQNMTQDALAEALFVTRQTVSNYETGRSNPDVQMLLKIAEVLGTDIDTLIFGKPEPPDRREERKRLIRCCVLSTVLLALYLVLNPVLKYYAFNLYHALPLYIARLTLFPGMYLSIGWTLVELVRYFIGIKPIPERTALWGRRITWGVLLACYLTLLPLILFHIYSLVLLLLRDSVSLTMNLGFFNHVMSAVSQMVMKHPYLFTLTGCALSLFRKIDQKPG